MRALLVWPRFESHSFWNFEKVCEMVGVRYMTPPLGLLTVAALFPRDWSLRLVDENVRPLSDEDLAWADMVFVGSKIVHRIRALEVIRLAKAAGRRVIVGGPDPTLNPSFYDEAGADHLCLDEGEVTLPLLLADLEAGTARRLYRAGGLADLEKSPIPRFDLVNLRDYLYVGLQYSRGCPYHCEFCNVVDLFDGAYRTKSVEQVIAELDLLYRLGHRGQVDFFDDNLVGHMKKVKPLLRAIARWQKAHHYPFLLSSSVTLNVALDDEILSLFREGHFKYFLVGIETPDQNALQVADKQQNVGISIAEAADRVYRKAGATLHSGFLLGMDGESPDVADRINECVDAASIPWVMAGVVYPLPGTRLSKRLDREKRLFPAARHSLAEGVRDQISAGLRFRPQRPVDDILADLLKVMQHAFEPEKYFQRCADVARRLNTAPDVFQGPWLFWRNLRTFLRLSWAMTRSKEKRAPYWKAFFQVLFTNPAGMPALVTLAVIHVHFQGMLPYVYGQIERQRATVREKGEEAWLRENLAEPEGVRAFPGSPLPVRDAVEVSEGR